MLGQHSREVRDLSIISLLCVHPFLFSLCWAFQILSKLIPHSLPCRKCKLCSHLPQLCPPDFTQSLGRIHLPDENLCSSKTAENACVIMHAKCQEEESVLQAQCDVRELFPGARHVLAASKSLMPFRNSHCVQAEDSVATFGKLHRSTSLPIYPKSNKWINGLSVFAINESPSSIMQ